MYTYVDPNFYLGCNGKIQKYHVVFSRINYGNVHVAECECYTV